MIHKEFECRYQNELEIRAYFQGVLEATYGLSIWRDGHLVVGVSEMRWEDFKKGVEKEQERLLGIYASK